MILGKWPTWRSSFLYIYFNSLHVSSNPVLIIRRINCINTTSGICHSVSVTVACAGPTCKRNGYRHTVTYGAFFLGGRKGTRTPKWWARGCSKHVENWNKYIENNCASSWSFTKKQRLCRSLNATVAQSKNWPFGVNTTIELKNITATFDINGI